LICLFLNLTRTDASDDLALVSEVASSADPL
jgi:hypothetical protein